MLLGWRIEDEVVVVAVIGPGPKASGARDRFTPDGAWQQQQLEDVYRDSKRTITYLGDWHSHPHGSGRPSKRDRQTAAAVAATPEARAPDPITLILARRRWRWRLHPHEHRGGKLCPIALKLHEPDLST